MKSAAGSDYKEELVLAFRDSKKQISSNPKQYQRAVNRLSDFLNDSDKKATNFYEGIGQAISKKSKLHVSFDEKNRGKVLEFLTQNGCEKIINNPKRLSKFIDKMIDDGKPTPDFIDLNVQDSLILREEPQP